MGIEHPLTEYTTAQNVATGIEIAVVFHNSALLCYHTFQTSRKKKKLTKSIQYLSILTILLTILTRIFAITISFGHHPKFISCQLLMKLLTAGFIANKIALYFFFAERLFSVFCASRYKFPSCFVYSSRITIISYGLLLNICTYFFCDAYYVTALDVCAGRWPPWLLMLAAAGDLGIVLAISILFTRKLMLVTIRNRLNRANSSLKDTNEKWIMCEIRKDEIMLSLLRRLVLLTVVALVTTFCSLVCIALFELASMWTSLDWVVNAYCIVFMFRIHQKQYKCMCKPLENAVICNGCLKCYSMHICCPITTIKKNQKKTISSAHSSGFDMPKVPPTPVQVHSSSKSITPIQNAGSDFISQLTSEQLFQIIQMSKTRNLNTIPDNETINIESPALELHTPHQTNVDTETYVPEKVANQMCTTSNVPISPATQNKYNNPCAKARKPNFIAAENETKLEDTNNNDDDEIDATTPLTPNV